jgi:SP family general alpha glucoside:H+ symporter-like MFS transporter
VLISCARVKSFAATGIPSCVLGYFIVPETTRRTPAEIDERKLALPTDHSIEADEPFDNLIVFEKKISLRKFKGYKTDVELNFENLQAQRMAGA